MKTRVLSSFCYCAPPPVAVICLATPVIKGQRSGIFRDAKKTSVPVCAKLTVTSGTIVNTTSLTDINNIEILRVDLNGISVTSVYKPPGERLSFRQPLTAVGDQQQVIIGDFNSHSSTWGYATTNNDGVLVEDWAENQRLSLIHDPKLPSSFSNGRWRRGYNHDIIFATNRIAVCCNKSVMEPVPRSQHRPIGVQVNAAITVQTVPFRRRRFYLKKANWEQFDAAVENIPATA